MFDINFWKKESYLICPYKLLFSVNLGNNKSNLNWYHRTYHANNIDVCCRSAPQGIGCVAAISAIQKQMSIFIDVITLFRFKVKNINLYINKKKTTKIRLWYKKWKMYKIKRQIYVKLMIVNECECTEFKVYMNDLHL